MATGHFPGDSLLITLYPYAFWELSAAAMGVLGISAGLIVWGSRAAGRVAGGQRAPMTATATTNARMLSLEEARARMLDDLAQLPVETLPLDAALGRVLAEPIESRLTLPPWDNSAMDGYAVRSEDVLGASDINPVELRVIGESAAGRRSQR